MRALLRRWKALPEDVRKAIIGFLIPTPWEALTFILVTTYIVLDYLR